MHRWRNWKEHNYQIIITVVSSIHCLKLYKPWTIILTLFGTRVKILVLRISVFVENLIHYLALRIWKYLKFWELQRKKYRVMSFYEYPGKIFSECSLHLERTSGLSVLRRPGKISNMILKVKQCFLRTWTLIMTNSLLNSSKRLSVANFGFNAWKI